jgi:hypothetical protein
MRTDSGYLAAVDVIPVSILASALQHAEIIEGWADLLPILLARGKIKQCEVRLYVKSFSLQLRNINDIQAL